MKKEASSFFSLMIGELDNNASCGSNDSQVLMSISYLPSTKMTSFENFLSEILYIFLKFCMEASSVKVVPIKMF